MNSNISTNYTIHNIYCLLLYIYLYVKKNSYLHLLFYFCKILNRIKLFKISYHMNNSTNINKLYIYTLHRIYFERYNIFIVLMFKIDFSKISHIIVLLLLFIYNIYKMYIFKPIYNYCFLKIFNH